MRYRFTIALAAVLLAACSTTTPDPLKNARNAGLNAAGAQALREAGQVLGKIAAQTLFAAVQSEATGKTVDFQQAAVAGLYANVDAASTSAAIGRVVTAYSAGKANQTATAAAAAAYPALSSGVDPSAVVNAVAAVISTAAGAPPAQ